MKRYGHSFVYLGNLCATMNELSATASEQFALLLLCLDQPERARSASFSEVVEGLGESGRPNVLYAECSNRPLAEDAYAVIINAP